jgi:hypothetical protein
VNTILTSLLPRIVQDLITSAAAVLTAHGFLAADGSQTQGFIGAAFFLVMLAFNYMLHLNHGATAATNGAAAVGGTISPSAAIEIAKGKTVA